MTGFPRRCEILLLTFSPPHMITHPPPHFLSMTSYDLEIGSLEPEGLRVAPGWVWLIYFYPPDFSRIYTLVKKSVPEGLLVTNIVNDKVVYIWIFVMTGFITAWGFPLNLFNWFRVYYTSVIDLTPPPPPPHAHTHLHTSLPAHPSEASRN